MITYLLLEFDGFTSFPFISIHFPTFFSHVLTKNGDPWITCPGHRGEPGDPLLRPWPSNPWWCGRLRRPPGVGSQEICHVKRCVWFILYIYIWCVYIYDIYICDIYMIYIYMICIYIYDMYIYICIVYNDMIFYVINCNKMFFFLLPRYDTFDLQEICRDDMLSALSKPWKKRKYPENIRKPYGTLSHNMSRHVTTCHGDSDWGQDQTWELSLRWRWDRGGTLEQWGIDGVDISQKNNSFTVQKRIEQATRMDWSKWKLPL